MLKNIENSLGLLTFCVMDVLILYLSRHISVKRSAEIFQRVTIVYTQNKSKILPPPPPPPPLLPHSPLKTSSSSPPFPPPIKKYINLSLHSLKILYWLLAKYHINYIYSFNHYILSVQCINKNPPQGMEEIIITGGRRY